MNTNVRRNKRMLAKPEEIYWSADDVSQYSFSVPSREKKKPESETEVKKEEVGVSEEAPGVTHSVASYFLTRYNYSLKYPKMPIVCTNEGYYPVEFLTQAQERKRGVDAKDYGLKFNDNFSGTARVDHVQRIKNLASSIEKNGIDMNAIMRQFNLTVSDEPQTFEASVLPAPKLKFAGNCDASIRNGSWNLRNVRFARYDCGLIANCSHIVFLPVIIVSLQSRGFEFFRSNRHRNHRKQEQETIRHVYGRLVPCNEESWDAGVA
jgi:hypothetical protein